MSKSTPISQLPNVPNFQQQQAPMDQQRAAAVQSFVLPQNTQSSSDIPEDDQTVQDVLNQLSGGTPQQAQVSPQMQLPPQQMQQQAPLPPPMTPMDMSQTTYMPSPMLMPQQGIMQPGMFSDTPSNHMFQSMTAPMELSQAYDEPKNSWIDMATLNYDIKNVILVTFIYVVISILPVQRFVYQYIAIDKIPYSHIAIKAVLAGLLFFVLARIL